jgi:23S rRNA (cytidine1920-2'-O)/16S rRNA (cytidine1409-2'-O)-methyltransferase
MKAPRQRIDRLLVERGLAATREKAQALVLAGQVRVAGQRVDKAGALVDPLAPVALEAGLPYVSRGGYKLAAALDHFGVDPAGRACADIGASTGGFTDVLLQRGAARVHAVDVGRGQLDWKLRSDPRVVLHEGLNARHLAPDSLGEAVSLAVCDVSFISVTLIVPVLAPLLEAGGEMIILVKPQFEAGRGQVGKGGIVRDPAVHESACLKVRQAVQQAGFETALMESPIAGAEGNKEFLLYGYRPHRRDHCQAERA